MYDTRTNGHDANLSAVSDAVDRQQGQISNNTQSIDDNAQAISANQTEIAGMLAATQNNRKRIGEN